MTEELVDILDENGKEVDIIKTKSEAHSQGLWHGAIHIWIYNSKGEILLQKRSMAKSTMPGLWDISVAGHLSAGERPKNAALRELHEELGVRAKPEELKEVASLRVDFSDSKQNYHNKEFVHIYLYKLDSLPSKLQEEEVAEVKFVTIDKFEKELADPKTVGKYAPWDYSDTLKIVRKSIKA